MTGYWLVKSEPDAFSWDQQVANRVEPWTGVRNHMAKNNLKAMRKGDLAFFYHSNIGKQIVGIVEVAREAYPDPTAESGDWVCVDMKAVRPLPKPVTLADIKADPSLGGHRAGASVAAFGHADLEAALGQSFAGWADGRSDAARHRVLVPDLRHSRERRQGLSGADWSDLPACWRCARTIRSMSMRMPVRISARRWIGCRTGFCRPTDAI